ncbi:MerR family DNA-binding protein [Streptomyces sp. NPDC001312]|uniref:MerR family DNA-binding protein n=1 Tax=Streptomyces sp. NPDC001312 TaxID=3364561 RepID=UPI0036B1676B
MAVRHEACNPADVELLTFIRRARTLGLHLDDVREVLAIRRGGSPPAMPSATYSTPASVRPGGVGSYGC